MNKLSILYCEDQERFREEFVRRHGEEFLIETLSDVQQVYRKLKNAKELPDLLLLDLYHPRDIPEQKELASEAEKSLAELRALIKEVKKKVDATWAPVGIDVLHDLRARYPAHRLPILIYTQRGLFLLEDEKLRELEENDADWLLKDAERISPATEAYRIRKYITRWRHSRRPARDIIIGVTCTCVGVVLAAIANALFF